MNRPFCALREEIRAKDQIRAQVSSDEGTPTLERSIEYDNEQLRREISPTFKPALLESGGEGWAYPSWSTSRRPGIRHARFTRASAPSGVYPKAGVQATAYCRRRPEPSWTLVQ